MKSRLPLLALPLIFGAIGIFIPAMWASQSHQLGIEHRLYPSLMFFFMTFGLVWLATHRTRSSRLLLSFSLLIMIASASFVCSLMQHELVLLNFPSLFSVPAFLWASLSATRPASFPTITQRTSNIQR